MELLELIGNVTGVHSERTPRTAGGVTSKQRARNAQRKHQSRCHGRTANIE